MAIQVINIGSSANKGDGDPLRTAFKKINENFAELDVTNTVKDIKGSVFADDSTVLVDSVNGTLNASALSGSLPAIDGSALTGLTVSTLAYSALTGTPTTISGYGITDAYTKTEVDSAITSSVLPSGSAQSIDVVAQDSTVLVDSVNGTINATTLTGALPAIDGSALTGVTTAFSNITSTPTTLAGYGITDAATLNNMAPTGAVDFTGATSVDFTGATITGTSFLTSYTETDPVVGAITGIVKADGSGNISAAVAGTDYLTTVAFSDLTGKPTTISGYGITDALALGTTSTTALAGDTALFDGVFASLTSKPTTISGYGITDAFDGAFSSLSGTPTTLSGYGITDALTAGGALTGSSLEAVAVGAGVADGNDLAITGGDATEVNSTGGDANITGGSGALTSGNVNIGATQTTLVTIGSGSNNVDFPNGTAVDFTGATVTGLPAAYSDSDVDTHLNTGSAGTNEVLSWTGSDYDWVAQSGGGSGLQSRSTATGTTGSLADAAEADLDITGFKAYALLTITTDRAARVRLYVTAATRTADASRAEGVDPTSDAGLIAEVITTGADTVIISPGAYGFNLESSPTTTIPCRVTNKSGGTSTVQVDLNILQLEA